MAHTIFFLADFPAVAYHIVAQAIWKSADGAQLLESNAHIQTSLEREKTRQVKHSIYRTDKSRFRMQSVSIDSIPEPEKARYLSEYTILTYFATSCPVWGNLVQYLTALILYLASRELQHPGGG